MSWIRWRIKFKFKVKYLRSRSAPPPPYILLSLSSWNPFWNNPISSPADASSPRNPADVMVNARKSCCMRIGPRHNVQCAGITSSSSQVIPWLVEIRYLGVKSSKFRCSVDEAKCWFYRAANAIFSKIGKIASEKVTLQFFCTNVSPYLWPPCIADADIIFCHAVSFFFFLLSFLFLA